MASSRSDKYEVPRNFREHNGRTRRIHGGKGYRYETDGSTYVRQWGNQIATREDNTITLTDCGWQTVTTRDMLNSLLPSGWQINQKSRVWYITYSVLGSGNSGRGGDTWEWNGKVVYDEADPYNSLVAYLNKHVSSVRVRGVSKANAMADEILKRMEQGNLADDGGECWLIRMFANGTGEKCVDCDALCIPDDCGGGSSLVMLAVRSKGYGPAFFWDSLTPDQHIDWRKLAENKRDDLKRALRAMFDKMLRGVVVTFPDDPRWTKKEKVA
jgi:hypothetical protein